MASNRITYTLDFKANLTDVESQLSRLRQSLIAVANMPLSANGATGKMKADLDQASLAAVKLKGHLQQGLNPKTGLLDLSRFAISLKTSGDNVQSLAKNMLKAGDTGKAAFMNVTNAMVNAQGSIIKTNSLMSSLWVTMKNTLKWQISSTVLTSILNVGSKTLGYFKSLDKTLNDIRIVSGDSADQMQRFAKEANKAASALHTTTNEFAKANLIYRQQGDSAAEAMKKAEITTKAANVSFGTSTEEMSNYLTAVWNSYQVAGDELELYIDKLVKVGAVTATSTDEMSTSMQKVAAAAHETGVEYDQLLGVISTVSSVTRESAESTGTAFKTIFARMTDLKLEGSIDEGGVTTSLGDVSGSLEAIGVNVLNAKGELRDTGDIITDLGDKWKYLDKNTRSAVAQVVAGKRQYTQLMALFGNWDMYKNTLKEISSAQGELNRQNEIYGESLDAASKKLSNNFDHLVEGALDGDMFISFTESIADVVWVIGELIEGLGGIVPILSYIGGIVLQKFAPQVSQGLVNIGMNVVSALGKSDIVIKKYLNEWSALMTQVLKGGYFKGAELEELNTLNLLLQYKEQMESENKVLNEQEKERNRLQYDYLKTQIEINNAKAKEAASNATYRKEAAENRFMGAIKSINPTFDDKMIQKSLGRKINVNSINSPQLQAVGDLTFQNVATAWDNLNNSARNEAITAFSDSFGVAEPIIRNYIEAIKEADSAQRMLDKTISESRGKVVKNMQEKGYAGTYIDKDTQKPQEIVGHQYKRRIDKANSILESPDSYSEKQVAAAKEVLEIYNQISRKKDEISKTPMVSEKDAAEAKQIANDITNFSKEITKQGKKGDKGKLSKNQRKQISNELGLSDSSVNLVTGKNVTAKNVFSEMSKSSQLPRVLNDISTGNASAELTRFLQVAAQTEAEGDELVKVIQNIMNTLNGVKTDAPEKELDDLNRKFDQASGKMKKFGEGANFTNVAQGLTSLGGSILQVSSSISMITSSWKQLTNPDMTGIEKIMAGFSLVGSIAMTLGTILPLLIVGIKTAKTEQDKFNLSVLKNPYIIITAVIIGAILGVAGALQSQEEAQKKANEAAEQAAQKAAQSKNDYESLKEEIKTTKEELKELQNLSERGLTSLHDEAELEEMDRYYKKLKREAREKERIAKIDAKDAYEKAHSVNVGETYTTTSAKDESLAGTEVQYRNDKAYIKNPYTGKYDTEVDENDISNGYFSGTAKVASNSERTTLYKATKSDLEILQAAKNDENIDKKYQAYRETREDIVDKGWNPLNASSYRGDAAEGFVYAQAKYRITERLDKNQEELDRLLDLEDLGEKLTSDQKERKEALTSLTQEGYQFLYEDTKDMSYFSMLNAENKKKAISEVYEVPIEKLDNYDTEEILDKLANTPPPKGVKKNAEDFMEKWLDAAEEKAEEEGDRPFKKVAAAVEKLGVMKNVFGDISEKGRITATTLQELEEKASPVIFDKYADALIKGKKGEEEFENALTNLTYDMVTAQVSTRELMNMTEEEIALMYEDAGVTNSSAMAKYTRAKALAAEINAGRIAVEQLENETIAAGYTKEEIAALMWAEYQLNASKLDPSQKIAALKQIYLAAGMAKFMLESVMEYTTISGQAAADYLMENEDQWRRQKNVSAIEKTRANGGKIYVDKSTGTIYTTEEGVQNANIRDAEKDLGTNWEALTDVPTPPSVDFSGGGGGSDSGSGGDSAEDTAKKLADLRKEEKEAVEEHIKAMEEWTKTDAIERYSDELKKLENVLDDLQRTLDKVDFEESLYGEEKTAEQAFDITYKKGLAAEAIATEALNQFNLLKDNMPQQVESLEEWKDQLSSLQETWQENVLAMKENSVSAALIAGIEQASARLEEESSFMKDQISIMESLNELTKTSSYFATGSRKALIASSLAKAKSFGAGKKSEEVQKKEEEAQELIKINEEMNKQISEANKATLEADIEERAQKREEEWYEIQKDFKENMDDLQEQFGELGASIDGLSQKYLSYADSVISKTNSMTEAIQNYNNEISKHPLFTEGTPVQPWSPFDNKSSSPLTGKDIIEGAAKKGYTAAAQGTKSAKGGITLVGEKGAELVIEPGGKAYLVGVNGPEFVNLKTGSEVMPAKDTKAVLKRSKTKPTGSSKKVDSFAEGTTGDNTISSGSLKTISSTQKSNKSFYDKEAKLYSDSLKDMSKEKEEYDKKLIDETQETYDTLYQQKVTQDQMVKDSNNLTLDEMKAYHNMFNTEIYNGIATNAENIRATSEKKAGEVQTIVTTADAIMRSDIASSATLMQGTINKMAFTLPVINGTNFVNSVSSILNDARKATGLPLTSSGEVREVLHNTGGGGDEAYSGKINATGNALRVYELLKQKGVPDMSAKAIVANLQGESGNAINPASVGDGGTSFGIAQWHDDRGRRMKEFVGSDWRSDLSGQVDFLLHEMETSYSNVYKTLMNPGILNPIDLIRKLVYEYEIPFDKLGATNARYKNYLQLVKGVGSSGDDGRVSLQSFIPYIDYFNNDPLSMFEIMTYASMIKNAMNTGDTTKLFELMGPLYEWTDPLDPGFHVGSGVGWRIHPIHGDKRFHAGVDIGAPQGTPIYAVRPGIVEFAGYGGGAGNFVKLQHDAGYATRYLHMVDLPSVSTGQMVRKGQIIGYVGSTGWSTGPHLHFEMYQNGQVIDPLPKLPNYVTGTGKGKTKVTENAIVGEIGPELAIFPDGSVSMLGQDGVEYARIPAGTKIFNTAQTMEFLKTPKNYATGTLEDKDARYLTELNEAAKKFGIPPELFIAMADAESNLGTHANTWKTSGNKKAVGITQLSEKIFDNYKEELESNEELKKALEENKISIDKARELNEENYKDNIWVTAAILKLIKDNKYKDDKDWKNVIGYYNSAGEEKWSEVAETAKHIEELFKAYATDTYKTENIQKVIEEAAKKITEATDKNTEETKKTTDAVKEMNIKRAGVKDITYQTTTQISDKGNPPIFNKLNAFSGIGGLSTNESGDVLASSDNYARIVDYFNASKEVQDMSYDYVGTRAFYSALNQVPNKDETYKAWAINAVEEFKKLDLDEGTQQLLDLLKEYLEAETLNVEEYRKALEPFLGALSYKTKTLEGYGIDAGMLYSSIVNQKEETWDEEGFKNKDIGVRNADQRILADVIGSVNTQVATIAKEKDISIKYINDLLVANGLMASDKHSGDIWSTETAAGVAKLLEDPKGIVTQPFLKDLRQMYISNQNGTIVGSLGEIVNMSRDQMKDYINNEELIDEIINTRIAVAEGYQLRDDEQGKRIAKQINDEFFKTMDITLGEDGQTVVDWDFKKPELNNAQYIRDLNEIQAKDAKGEFEDNNEFIKQFSQVNINAAKEFRNQADAMYDEQQRQDKLWDIRYKHGEVSEEEYAAYKEYAAEVYETVADIIEQEEEMYRTAYESNKELYEQYVNELTQRYELAANKAETLGSLYEQHFSTMNNLADVQHEINNTLRDSMMNTQWLDKKTRELLFDENDHYKITQKISDIREDMMLLTEDYQTKINSLTEDEWYKQERLTAEYQRQVQEKERSLAILRAEVGLEAKRNALTQALQEKNVRVFSGGRWQNVANFNDVRTKAQEYENQLYEIEKAEREQSQAGKKDEFAREAETQREAISAMNQAMQNLDEEFEALFGALGNLSDKSIPDLINGLKGQESTLLSVMSGIGEEMGLEEDPGIEAAKRSQETNDLYEVNKESIFALYEKGLKNMLEMELNEEDSNAYNSAKDNLETLKTEIEKLGGEEFSYMLDNFGFSKNIQKIKSHQGSGDEYDAILNHVWANAGNRATSQLLSAKYNYAEAAEIGDEKLKFDATRKGKRARDVLGDLPYYESWKTWEGSIEEMEQKMAEYSEDLLTYALGDFFLESGARDDENIKSILNTYATAKKTWSDIDKKEKSGEISKERAQKDKNAVAGFGVIQRAEIGDLGYDKVAELLQVLSEEQLQTLINMVYGDVIPTLRDDTGLIDMPQGQLFEMSTLKNTLLNESESIKNLAMSLMSGLLPEEIKNLTESNSTHVESIYIELPNVTEANTFAEEFRELVENGFINKPK